MILRNIFLICSAFMIGVAWYLGANIRFEEQWVLYEALRTTASIIFAVVGVIVYPERLKSPFSQTFSSPVYRRGFKQLFSPVISSIFILSIVLLVGLLAPLLKHIEAIIQYIPLCRKISFSLLASLTMWQIYTVLSVLVPLLNILSKNENDCHASNIINKLKGEQN
ncbi:TPA: hypothetical protein ACP17H_001626 [Neisseria meningitidis]